MVELAKAAKARVAARKAEAGEEAPATEGDDDKSGHEKLLERKATGWSEKHIYKGEDDVKLCICYGDFMNKNIKINKSDDNRVKLDFPESFEIL